MQFKVMTKGSSQTYALEPSGYYLVNLETREAKPCKKSDAEIAAAKPKTVFISTSENQQRPAISVFYNWPEGTVLVFQASQHTQEGKLISQGNWDLTMPQNPFQLPQNLAVRFKFPNDVSIEIGWQKS